MDAVNWTTVVSVAGAAVLAPASTVLAAWIANRGKRAQEIRLSTSTQAEVDARLIETFVGLMAKANARGSGYVAESALAEVVKAGPLVPKTPKEFHDLVEAASNNFPVGSAEQDAAILAIAELGVKHPLLRSSAVAGVQALETLKPAAAQALEKLRGRQATPTER